MSTTIKPPRTRVGPPPRPTETLNNLKPGEGPTKDLGFKVDPAFHYRFKMTATRHNLSMVDLLKRSYDLYVKEHGE